MTEKCYGIYFDRFELEVDADGNLANPEVLQIIEFEYDQDELIAVRRVDENGEVIADQWTCSDDLRHVGWDDDETIEKAMGRFERWLEDNLEWKQISPATYLSPAEYICIGIREN